MTLRVPRIDFVARRSTSMLGVALLVVGCIASGLAVYDDAAHDDDVERLNAELRHAQKGLARVQLRVKGDTGPILEGNVPVDWSPRLLTPWDRLFQGLEHAQTDSVALLSIEPDAGRSRLRLGGEAKSAEALVEYLKNLKVEAPIDGLRILMQQIKQNDPQQPIEFLIDAHWNAHRHVEKAS